MAVLVQVEGLLINNARLSGTLPHFSPTRRSNDQTPLYKQLQTLSIAQVLMCMLIVELCSFLMPSVDYDLVIDTELSVWIN